MWIRLQDHPATALKHMALIDRNEAGISIVHIPPYTVADLEGDRAGSRTPPPWASNRRNMHFRILQMIATSGFLATVECTEFVFRRSSASAPTGGAYIVPQTP